MQFVLWLSRVVQGELGRSFFLGQPVLDAILGRLPVTLSLTAAALFCAVLIGVPIGVRAATRPNSATDLGAMATAVVGLSVPDFALGLGLIVLFGVALQWLPVSGYVPLSRSPGGFVQHLVLPALALGIPQGALIARITRSSMLEALAADYVRTARAKGLGEPAVVGWHAFRNTLIHVVTVVGSVAVILLGGAFVVETVFNLPGLGNLVVMAVKRRDYPLVQGCLLLISTVVILVNLVVDVLYAYPRSPDPVWLTEIQPGWRPSAGRPPRLAPARASPARPRRRRDRFGGATLASRCPRHLDGSHGVRRPGDADVAVAGPLVRDGRLRSGSVRPRRPRDPALALGGLLGAGGDRGAGAVPGLVAGFVPRADAVIMRGHGRADGVPAILLALSVMAIAGPSTVNVVGALGVAYAPRVARLARASVLAVRSREFVDAAARWATRPSGFLRATSLRTQRRR